MTKLNAVIRILVCASLLALAHVASAQPSYTLNPGDKLLVDVWNEETLTREVVVLPDGYVSYPLAGDVRFGGRTAAEAADALAQALDKYLKDAPTVTVSILELSGNRIYVLGKVNRPGIFPINRPTDVMQALAMAGGLNTFAAEDDISVLRRIKNGEQVSIPFEYGEVKQGEDLETNILLQSGDIVVVR